MRYQELIYIQNSNSAVRNKDILNANMSSDMCIFVNPQFNLSGASKVECECSCPDGYTLLSGGLCQKITITGATAPLVPVTINQNTSSAYYIIEGAVIFEDITNKQWPLITTPQTGATALYNSIIPSAGTANGVAYTSVSTPTVGIGQHDNVNTPAPNQWPPTGTTGYGLVSPRQYFQGVIRESDITSNVLTLGVGSEILPVQFLNGQPWNTTNTYPSNTPNWFEDVGIWASGATDGEWYGFTQCVDIPTTKTYYIAFAGNNAIRIKLNGELLVEMNLGDGLYETLTYANIVPITLSAGTNIFYVEALNYSGNGGMALDIYDTDLATLTAVTTPAQLADLTIFSTASKLGQDFETGTVSASTFSCPTGFLYSNCTGSTCTMIENQGCDIITGTSYVLSRTDTTLPVAFEFTANTDSFTANNATFTYEVYKFDGSVSAFTPTPIYTSSAFTYDYINIYGTNTMVQELPLANLKLDGEYLVKGYFNFDMCTDFGKRLGKKIDTRNYRSGTKYGLYESEADYYFMAMWEAEKPEFLPSASNTPPAGKLFQQVILPKAGTTVFAINYGISGNFIVTLNGLVLANNYDYTYSGNIVTLSSATVAEDIITIIYTTSGGYNFIVENIDVTTAVPSGATGNEGLNLTYFNTTTGKYEVYTQATPQDGGSVLIMINGVTLANGVDYYQSTSNPKRFILEGNIMVGDMITLAYFPNVTVINGLLANNPMVTWVITNPPQSTDGIFTIEVSTGSSFTTIYTSTTVDYVVNQQYYSGTFVVSGNVGTQYYYRVKNEKNYTTICGEIVTSVVYSDIIPIVVQSNAINSY